jgi:Tfp pilus assembly protein PilF
MNNQRIEQLLEWLESEPDDIFTLYALAMEHKEQMPEKAAVYLEKLRQIQPSYTATYYHLAEIYQKLGDRERAEGIYQVGIGVCKEQKAQHSLAELQNAYQNFLYEED